MPRQYDVMEWTGLSARDRNHWSALRRVQPHLRSPYFSLGFFDAVASARKDLLVLRVSDRGDPLAFLPFHRSRLGFASPGAGPLSDWHGFVAEPGSRIEIQPALRAARLSGFRFHGAPAADEALAPYGVNRKPSHLIDLSRGHHAWREERGKALQGLIRQQRRLGKEGVRAQFTLDDRDPQSLACLFAWKGEQFLETGQIDQLSLRWTRRLLSQIAHALEPDFRGLVSSLRLDGELAAVHLGMVSGRVLHYWFPAYSRSHARLAPGALLLDALAREAGALGVTEIDLGKGDYRYKREFSNSAAPLMEGLVGARSFTGKAYAGMTALARTASALPLGAVANLPERALRRLERDAALRQGEDRACR